MLARLLVADGVMELQLHLKSLKEFLQLRNEIDEGSDDEDSNQELPRPVFGSDITVADRTESDKHKPVSVKEGDFLLVVNALNVVEEAHPGSGGGGGEGGKREGDSVLGEGGGRRVVRERDQGAKSSEREAKRRGESRAYRREGSPCILLTPYSSPREVDGN